MMKMSAVVHLVNNKKSWSVITYRPYNIKGETTL